MLSNEISILIVDDNPHFIQRMANLLRESSDRVHVYTAGNYDEALKQLDSRKHDTILLDINLPGRNGITLLKKILERNCHCKVVIISNNSSDYYRKQCEKLGAIHFLDKTTEFHLAPSIVTNTVTKSRKSHVPC
jgi:two-component system chemotaxis response regulator CheY